MLRVKIGFEYPTVKFETAATYRLVKKDLFIPFLPHIS